MDYKEVKMNEKGKTGRKESNYFLTEQAAARFSSHAEKEPRKKNHITEIAEKTTTTEASLMPRVLSQITRVLDRMESLDEKFTRQENTIKALSDKVEALEKRPRENQPPQNFTGVQNLTLQGWLRLHRNILFTQPELDVAEGLAREKFSNKYGKAPKIRNHKALFYNSGIDDDILSSAMKDARQGSSKKPNKIEKYFK